MSTPAADLSLPSLATPSGGFWRRHADLLLPAGDRVPGVDLARGLAILGMFAAHVGVTSDDFSTGEGWLSLVHGRSSILFAVIAGVSLALVSGRRTPLTGVPALQARTRILVRAVLLLALAGLLDVLGTPVALILGFYAAYFVLALPFLRWSPPRLAGLALVVAVLGPPVAYWWPEIMLRAELWLPMDGSGALTDFLLTGTYPALVWMAFVLAGLAVLGLCLLLGSSRAVLRVLAPLAAVGSMALTVYCLQVLAIWAWEDQLMSATGNGELALLVVASLVFATVWRWALGRGPLERFVGWVAGRAASITPSAAPPDDPSPTRRDAAPTAPPTPRGDVQSGA